MSQITNGKVAEIEYTLKLDDGEIVDATDGKPLPYLHGAGQLVSGLEEALEGRNVGDNFTVVLEPDDGYGEADEELVEIVSRDSFPPDMELVVGEEVVAEEEGGEEFAGTIAEVTAEEVVVDFNHPLAGERLTFDVQVLQVREATPEEVAAGGVDDPYDDDHECDETCAPGSHTLQ